MESLDNKYIYMRNDTQCVPDENAPATLGLKNMAGTFVVLPPEITCWKSKLETSHSKVVWRWFGFRFVQECSSWWAWVLPVASFSSLSRLATKSIRWRSSTSPRSPERRSIDGVAPSMWVVLKQTQVAHYGRSRIHAQAAQKLGRNWLVFSYFLRDNLVKKLKKADLKIQKLGTPAVVFANLHKMGVSNFLPIELRISFKMIELVKKSHYNWFHIMKWAVCNFYLAHFDHL